MVKEEKNDAKTTAEDAVYGCGCLGGIVVVGALLVALFVGIIDGCSSSSYDDDYSYSSSSSLSDDEKQRRALEEEASKYSYDDYGHLQKNG